MDLPRVAGAGSWTIGCANIFWSDVTWEYLGYVYAVPVIVVNGWEWFDPEFMEKLVEIFGKREKSMSQ